MTGRREAVQNAQIGILDELFVDNFAGAGGASVGIELATGRPVSIAVNHDEVAVMLHKKNHPWTKHLREDVFAVDPAKECGGRHVRLAWFSPDCKHFSRAKGAALVDRKIRGLAWIVLRWAGTVHPDVILLENVPEFVTWGPVRKGKPVKSKAGQTYRKWYAQLSALGYRIETRELCAADYGVPTIRTRFYLIARRDGQAIRWPEKTHGKRTSEEVISGRLQPWKPASECIDFSLPCFSVFESKEAIQEQYGSKVVRPLAKNTMARVAHGLDRFVIRAAEPFIVECNHAGAGHIQAVDEPIRTVTARYTGGVCAPYLTQYHTERGEKARGQDARDPLMTVDGSNRYGLVAGYLTQYFGGKGHIHSVYDPMGTATTRDRECMTVAHIHKYFGGCDGTDVSEPLPTVTAWDHNALELAHLAHFKGSGDRADACGQSMTEPLRTVTAADGQFAEVRTVIARAGNGISLGHWPEVRAMLNQYCGYGLGDDELLLIRISGGWYFISDVGLRMLTPRELARAMGFPDDYVIERFADGTPVPRSQQVAKIGNAVCPRVAEALVRANLPECAPRVFAGVEELNQYMSV